MTVFCHTLPENLSSKPLPPLPLFWFMNMEKIIQMTWYQVIGLGKCCLITRFSTSTVQMWFFGREFPKTAIFELFTTYPTFPRDIWPSIPEFYTPNKTWYLELLADNRISIFQHIRKLRGVSKFRWSSVHPVFTIPSSPLKRRKVVETFMVMRSESEFFICPWHVWLVDSTRERSRETVWQSKVTISSAAPSSFSPAKGSSTCTLAVSARSNFDPFHCNIHCEPLNGHQHN